MPGFDSELDLRFYESLRELTVDLLFTERHLANENTTHK